MPCTLFAYRGFESHPVRFDVRISVHSGCRKRLTAALHGHRSLSLGESLGLLAWEIVTWRGDDLFTIDAPGP